MYDDNNEKYGWDKITEQEHKLKYQKTASKVGTGFLFSVELIFTGIIAIIIIGGFVIWLTSG